MPKSGYPRDSVYSDGGMYYIDVTTQVNRPSIEGTRTFKQFWSVRKSKRSSGTITCRNHFDAWTNTGMKLGNFYEVSFVVEGYQSKGNAEVTMAMTTSKDLTNINNINSYYKSVKDFKTGDQSQFITIKGTPQLLYFEIQKRKNVDIKVYNFMGQEI